MISEQTYKTVLLQHPTLQPSNLTLHTYTGELLTVLGQLLVRVQYHNQSCSLPLIVVSGRLADAHQIKLASIVFRGA